MMNTTSLVPLRLTGLEVLPAARDGMIVLAFKGNADMTVSVDLGTFFKRVDLEARTTHRNVRVDFRELYFMSSSCLQKLAYWIVSVGKLDPKERYEVQFETLPAHKWQRRSLEAIRCAAPDIMAIL